MMLRRATFPLPRRPLECSLPALSPPDAASRLLLSVPLAVWLAVGCGGPSVPKTAPAGGVVTYRGAPVEGATVIFGRGDRDLARGEVAIGRTDAQGRFALTTHVAGKAAAKGAVPGDYGVTVSKHVPPPGMSMSEYQSRVDAATRIGAEGGMLRPDQEPPALVEMMPRRYSVAGESTLEATVELRGPNEFLFDLE